MTKNSLRVGLAALATGTMLLAGCGSSDSTEPTAVATTQATGDNGVAALGADEILTKSKDALKKAGSFQMKGSAAAEGATMALDFRISGADFSGALTMGEGADVKLLLVGGKQYMKPTEGFWTLLGLGEMAKTITAAAGDKWLLVPAGDESMSAIFTAANVDELLKPSGTIGKGEATQISGQPVIGLTDSGDKASQLFVATTGEPYPIKQGTPTGEGVTFSEFGTAFTDIKAPAADQVLDISKVTGQK